MAQRLRLRKTPSPVVNDLGLGLRGGRRRGVNKDGSFNIRRTGLPRFRPYELYHQLIAMPLPRFVLLLLAGFALANACFASIYLLIGMENFARVGGAGMRAEALDAFFFSAQTLTTVGYGHIHPVSPLTNTVAAIESMVGLLAFALACGLLYGRFSRPHARIRFSRQGVVASYREGRAFMFRIVNERSNQLIEVEASVSLSMIDPTSGLRVFHMLTLERHRINLFPSNWTLVHPLDEESPLAGLDEAAWHAADVEFIVLIKAFDDTFAQTVYARSSYKAEEVTWGSRFVPMLAVPEQGHPVVDLGLLDAVHPEVADVPGSALKG